MARALVLALVVVIALGTLVPAAAAVGTDSGSISRDARGPQPTGDYAPLGSPPSPGLYLLNQTTIFIAGLVLLLVAALLGAYTMVASRRAAPRA